MTNRRLSGHFSSSDDEEAPVYVFDQTSFGIRRKDPSEWNQKKEKPGVFDATSLEEKKKPMDAEDIADMEVSEIWERLKNAVEDISASALDGRGKRKYLQEKAARLSGHPIAAPKTPFKILKGMREKAKIRSKRAKEEARVSDAVVAIKQQNSAVGTKTKRAKRSRRH